MADVASETAAAESPGTGGGRRSKLPLILGLVLALAGGGGGFYAVSSGLFPGGHGEEEAAVADAVPPLPDIAFVALDPIVINLGETAQARHLRFQAQLEVAAPFAEEVRAILPRIVDVLNSYLRAVEVAEIEDRAALVRLRAQMLRRVQLVAGAGRIRDLLIMEFVLN